MPKKKEVTIPRPMEQRIREAARCTWQAIGADTLRGVGEDMTRDHVVETVCDASYMEMYGQDREACDFLRTLSVEQQYKVVSEAFPHKTYGW